MRNAETILNIIHVNGQCVAGEPDAMKVARPVRREPTENCLWVTRRRSTLPRYHPRSTRRHWWYPSSEHQQPRPSGGRLLRRQL